MDLFLRYFSTMCKNGCPLLSQEDLVRKNSVFFKQQIYSDKKTPHYHINYIIHGRREEGKKRTNRRPVRAIWRKNSVAKNGFNELPMGYEHMELYDMPDEFQTIRTEFEQIQSDNPYQMNHERSRFLLYKFRNGKISSKLYNFLCKNHFLDIDLTIYWSKQGYENLCCTICVQIADKNDKKVCVCRVPREKLKETDLVECSICKCMGCSG